MELKNNHFVGIIICGKWKNQRKKWENCM